MLTFKPVTLQDREKIHGILYAAGRQGCEYSFANLYFWTGYYGGVAIVDGFLCQESSYGGEVSYFFPAGVGSPRAALEALRQDAADRGVPFLLRSVTRADMAVLDALYPHEFTYAPIRDAFDYTYPVEQLTNLAGKKLQSKRNHINRFETEYPDYKTAPVTAENVALCRDMAEKWYAEHASGEAIDMERRALQQAFDHFDELGMEGLLLSDGKQVVAFTMGNRITRETFDVNFEKAFAQVNGAYPMINREFSRQIAAKYPEITTLNREDDMGVEGLRKAKESYHPILLEKFSARLGGEA